jgi:hypothetical protein
VTGKHEPATNRSFYISLGTSTLRAIILVAAVVVGIIVLKNAFPQGTSPRSAGTPTPSMSHSTSSSPATSPSPPTTQKPRAPKNVVVQVLNGSGVSLAAKSVTDHLAGAGYKTRTEGNAPHRFARTTLFYQADSLLEAQALQQKFFHRALLKPAPSAYPKAVDITVVLGTDYSPGA